MANSIVLDFDDASAREFVARVRHGTFSPFLLVARGAMGKVETEIQVDRPRFPQTSISSEQEEGLQEALGPSAARPRRKVLPGNGRLLPKETGRSCNLSSPARRMAPGPTPCRPEPSMIGKLDCRRLRSIAPPPAGFDEGERNHG